jgi:hypothetical protein
MSIVPPAREVRRVAAHLPAAAKTGDTARTAELLAQVKTTRQLVDLVLLLARCADWGRLNAETGYIAAATPRELHAYYKRLRSRGVPVADIASYIRDGETAYQLESRRARRAKAAGIPAGASIAAVSLRTPAEGHGKGPGSPEGAPSLSGPQESAA